jgi:hypothetical protein
MGIIIACGCVLAIPVAILGYLGSGSSIGTPLTIAAYTTCVLLLVTGVIFVWIGMKCAWGRQYPIGIALALQYPVFPSIFRPVLSVWWTLQACLSIAGVVNSRLSNPQSSEVVTAIVSLLFMYASNSFLLLALSTWTRDPKTLSRAWKCRHGLNLAAMTVIVLLL